MTAGKKKPEDKNTDTLGSTRSLRDDAEKKLAHSPDTSPDLKVQTLEQLVHELQVHQIELETQAEELRIAGLTLEESRDKFLDLYDFAPLGYITLSDKGLITEVNLTGAKMLGIERVKLVKAPFSKFITTKDADPWYWYFLNVMDHEEKRSCTLMLIRKDGSVFPARLEGMRNTGSNGTITVRIVFTDVSDIWKFEDALRESEKKYHNLSTMLRLMSDNLPDMIWAKDLKKRYIFANKAICRGLLNAADTTEPVGKQDMFFAKRERTLHADDPEWHTFGEICRDTDQITMDAGTPQQFDEYGNVQGKFLFLDVHKAPFFDEHGEMIGTVGSARDVTDRKRAEEALRKSEGRYKIITETTTDFVFSCIKPKGGTYSIDWVAGASERIIGYTIDELIAIGCWRCLVLPEDTLIFDENIINLPVGTSRACTLRIRTKSGSLRWLAVNTTHVPAKDSSLVNRVVGSCRDITERKRAEDELAESEKKYRALFSAESDGIFVIDKESGTIIDSNDAITEMYGYQKDEVIGQLNSSMSAEPDATIAATKEVNSHIPIRYHRRKEGSIFPVEITASVVSLQGRDVIIAAVRDITKRKLADDALSQANKKLTLLSSITRHDITNQLTVLVGYLRILEKKQPDPALNEYFVKISTAAQRISSMIQFTREYEKVGVDSPKWQDCRTIVDTAAKQVPLGNLLLKNVLPVGTEVFADPLIVKVFYNIMDNAVRYGGKITTIRFYVEEAGDEHLIVCDDDGNGIVAEEKEKIFERGFGKNTGLGLALAREILAISGITIRENGEPGKGARFEMGVPKGAWRFMGTGKE